MRAQYLDKLGGIVKGGQLKTKDGKSVSQVEELYIQAEGTDLQHILNMEDVDPARTYCTDLPELY